MAQADLETTSEGSVLVARVTGEIDLSNADGLLESLTGRLSNQASALVLDLAATEYLDSAGIQLVYQLRDRLRLRGQGLRLVVPDTSPAQDALRLAGVQQHVETVPTVQEALRELSPETAAGGG
jgi:anti-anti-sigma factor